MRSSTCILILCKNPILGKAKTRLARSIGAIKALEVYHFLLEHTAHAVDSVASDKYIFYSDEIGNNDVFQGKRYYKSLQQQGDLGQRMQLAFEEAFSKGYQRVVIIGSDCYELSAPILEQALIALKHHEVVLGPAKDGGYYLLGLQKMLPAVFENQPWSQAHLLDNTLKTIKQWGATYQLLPTLSDVDYLEDLPMDVRKKFGI